MNLAIYMKIMPYSRTKVINNLSTILHRNRLKEKYLLIHDHVNRFK